jgi:hypothetical protein
MEPFSRVASEAVCSEIQEVTAAPGEGGGGEGGEVFPAAMRAGAATATRPAGTRPQAAATDGDGEGEVVPTATKAGAAAATRPAARRGVPGSTAGPEGSPPACDLLPCQVLGVEHHARQPKDYYSRIAFLDVAAFMYVALFYQVVMSSARTLADITDEKQLPWDYLATLIILFLFMVSLLLVNSMVQAWVSASQQHKVLP